ncbi:Protein CBG18877 [Caenorhabditis briggsae]|uniref:Protein CBG18877 n=1 Tax=Caenorhabditis briggsae TaxID=6238 RepID=A8XU95_CAEBR|nr:Protein CBG18877 [Caenorhabditis briggsae]CAP36220.2 Protein CBG18877 [Caenorhabditis briggsae]
MNNCKYQDGFCEIKKNEIITWDVNRDQKCQFISIGILDGMYNNKLWVNNKNQIALNFQSNKTVQDCNSNLMISDEGFAVKRIERSQYSPRHIPIPIPSYSQQDIQRQDENKKNSENVNKRNNRESGSKKIQNEVLESLIRESPRRYIQKQLNHSAIKVRFIDSQDPIVQVTFCKEIDEEEIDFIDLTRFDGYKLSLALTLGQIPIKIKSLGDKIWYYKNDNFGGVISSKPQLHPMIDYRTNITNMKDFKEYDLKFLDDKVVFHEHILLDLKTNIEEELIEEMREKSDVSIEAHASNQDSTLPHEILDDVEGFFGKWWLRIWRVGVTLPAMFVYLFIARSFWMILSPKTFIDRKNRKRRREYEAVELREMPSIQSLTVD